MPIARSRRVTVSPGVVGIDDDRADARGSCDAVEAAEHDIGLRHAGAGDPVLRPVQHPGVAVPLGARLEVGGRRSRVRLGDGDGRLVALDDPGRYSRFCASVP